jgi:hypothetical protein
MSNCYESIRQKVDQTQRRHIFNMENPPRRRGKTTGIGQQQAHYFSGGYKSQETYNDMSISCGLQVYL